MYSPAGMVIRAAAVAVVTSFATSPAWAIAGGGFAPGGPMSGSMRPSCNGYNMDGTVNTSLGADKPGCTDHSERSLNRAHSPPSDR